MGAFGFGNPFDAIKKRIEEAKPGTYMNDPIWRFANARSKEITEEEREGHFDAAQMGAYLLPKTTAGAIGPGYTDVGMNRELAGPRRLEEDEEEMYKRAGIFSMTPARWA
jgi:hypothetical protein